MKIITVETSRLNTFKESWPCHGINDEATHIVVAFSDDGDLVDYECCNDNGDNVDDGVDSGEALSALFTDAFYNHEKKSIPGTIGSFLTAY